MNSEEFINENETVFTPDTRTLAEVPSDAELDEMEGKLTDDIDQMEADDLDRYHQAMSDWVTDLVGKFEPAEIKALEVIATVAEMGLFKAEFFFQDESPANFNHDVMLECQRRLGA